MSAEKLSPQSINSVYSISGMTCESCVKTITDKISAIPDVASVKVSLNDKKAEILSNRKIDISEVRQALSASAKYSVDEFKPQAIVNSQSKTSVEKPLKPLIEKPSLLKTYKPLITVFTFILMISLAFQISLGVFNSELFMNHLMAGFFIGLSFFKFLDLKAFAESFSSYDPLAQRWLFYGYIYPFVELALGFLFVANKALPLANTLTIIVLFLTTIGVYKRLQSKSQFQCACLGTTFNLPLSNVTIFENVAMILMAIYGLFF